MYQKATKSIQLPFNKLWNRLPEEFAEGENAVLALTTEDFNAMLERYTLDGDREMTEKSEIDAKAQLHKDFIKLFNDLGEKWREEVDIPAEKVDCEPEEPVLDLADLEVKDEPDEDDDLFGDN